MIDVDGGKNAGTNLKKYPNLALMKISAWHKQQGDSVEWHFPLNHYDIVYMAKVFSFTKEPYMEIMADKIIRGGTGYHIHLEDGIEVADEDISEMLPDKIEHIYPDYELYRSTTKGKYADTAFGFMSRGCPKGLIHKYCHVGAKEGLCSHRVADLTEFWRGQKNIQLLDPNTLACKDAENILNQLADSGAVVDVNQGLDIQLLTPQKAEILSAIKISHVHFAWDSYGDKDIVVPKFRELKERTGWGRQKVSAYVLCNFDTTMEQNLERIYFLRSLDFQPYVMLYDKEHIPKGHELRRLQRWCNNNIIFWSCERFEDYLAVVPKKRSEDSADEQTSFFND